MLPKFLLADNSQELPETIFVIHTRTPRFIVGFDIGDFNSNQEIHWLDEQPKKEHETNELLNAAELFVEEELDHQEELFDEEENIL